MTDDHSNAYDHSNVGSAVGLLPPLADLSALLCHELEASRQALPLMNRLGSSAQVRDPAVSEPTRVDPQPWLRILTLDPHAVSEPTSALQP